MMRVSAIAIPVPPGASSEFRTPGGGGIASEIEGPVNDLLKAIQKDLSAGIRHEIRFVTQSEGDYEDLNAGIRHHVLISVFWDDGQ